MNTLIKLRRGTRVNIDNYTPYIGEIVISLDEEKVYIGDGLVERGYSLLYGDHATIEDNSFYGSRTNKIRGFHNSFDHTYIYPKGVTIDAAGSGVSRYTYQHFDTITFDNGATSAIWFIVPIKDYIDITKDINFYCTYALTDDTTIKKTVELKFSYWIIDSNYDVSSFASGSPDYTTTDYIYSTEEENINKVYKNNLTFSKIDSSYLSANTMFVYIKVSRETNVNDFAGKFRLINLITDQIGISDGYFGYNFAGAVTSVDPYTYTKNIDKLVFPFDGATTGLIGDQVNSLYSRASFNSSRYVYVAGGINKTDSSDSSPTYSDSIETIDFRLDSGNATAFGSLYSERSEVCGLNSSNYGYVCNGKKNNTFYEDRERISFMLDSGNATSISESNNQRALSRAFNASNYGYIVGGYLTGSDLYDSYERFSFANDTEAGTVVNTFSLVTGGGPGTDGSYSQGTCNSSTYGYTGGGQGLSSLTRLNFSDPTTGPITKLGELNSSKSRLAGCNSMDRGYFISGRNAGAGTEMNDVESISFPFDSGTAFNIATISNSDSDNCASDNVDFVTMFV